jgi:hypothetical protein
MAQDPLSLLCVEPRFPGRLSAIADWLVRKRGYRCQSHCASANLDRNFWPASGGRGLEVIQFNVGGVVREHTVPWTRDLERGLCYAYGCYEVLHAPLIPRASGCLAACYRMWSPNCWPLATCTFIRAGRTRWRSRFRKRSRS